MKKILTIEHANGEFQIIGIEKLRKGELDNLSYQINKARKNYITEFVKEDVESQHGKMTYKEFKTKFESICTLIIMSSMDAIKEFTPEA